MRAISTLKVGAGNAKNVFREPPIGDGSSYNKDKLHTKTTLLFED